VAFLDKINTLGIWGTLQIAVVSGCVWSSCIFLSIRFLDLRVSNAQLRFGVELFQLFCENYALHVTGV